MGMEQGKGTATSRKGVTLELHRTHFNRDASEGRTEQGSDRPAPEPLDHLQGVLTLATSDVEDDVIRPDPDRRDDVEQ